MSLIEQLETAEANNASVVSVPVEELRAVVRANFELRNEVSAQKTELRDWQRDAQKALTEKRRIQDGVVALERLARAGEEITRKDLVRVLEG